MTSTFVLKQKDMFSTSVMSSVSSSKCRKTVLFAGFLAVSLSTEPVSAFQLKLKEAQPDLVITDAATGAPIPDAPTMGDVINQFAFPIVDADYEQPLVGELNTFRDPDASPTRPLGWHLQIKNFDDQSRTYTIVKEREVVEDVIPDAEGIYWQNTVTFRSEPEQVFMAHGFPFPSAVEQARRRSSGSGDAAATSSRSNLITAQARNAENFYQKIKNLDRLLQKRIKGYDPRNCQLLYKNMNPTGGEVKYHDLLRLSWEEIRDLELKFPFAENPMNVADQVMASRTRRELNQLMEQNFYTLYVKQVDLSLVSLLKNNFFDPGHDSVLVAEVIRPSIPNNRGSLWLTLAEFATIVSRMVLFEKQRELEAAVAYDEFNMNMRGRSTGALDHLLPSRGSSPSTRSGSSLAAAARTRFFNGTSAQQTTMLSTTSTQSSAAVTRAGAATRSSSSGALSRGAGGGPRASAGEVAASSRSSAGAASSSAYGENYNYVTYPSRSSSSSRVAEGAGASQSGPRRESRSTSRAGTTSAAGTSGRRGNSTTRAGTTTPGAAARGPFSRTSRSASNSTTRRVTDIDVSAVAPAAALRQSEQLQPGQQSLNQPRHDQRPADTLHSEEDAAKHRQFLKKYEFPLLAKSSELMQELWQGLAVYCENQEKPDLVRTEDEKQNNLKELKFLCENRLRDFNNVIPFELLPPTNLSKKDVHEYQASDDLLSYSAAYRMPVGVLQTQNKTILNVYFDARFVFSVLPPQTGTAGETENFYEQENLSPNTRQARIEKEKKQAKQYCKPYLKELQLQVVYYNAQYNRNTYHTTPLAVLTPVSQKEEEHSGLNSFFRFFTTTNSTTTAAADHGQQEPELVQEKEATRLIEKVLVWKETFPSEGTFDTKQSKPKIFPEWKDLKINDNFAQKPRPIRGVLQTSPEFFASEAEAAQAVARVSARGRAAGAYYFGADDGDAMFRPLKVES